MRYCARCVFPENGKPTILFDEEGVCSGCRFQEKKQKETINWVEREKWFSDLLQKHKSLAKETGNPYDCLLPVSGGKDSHFQAHILKVKYGMNPLMVTYNHVFNSKLGIANLTNMVKKFDFDLLRFTSNPDSVRKIARYMLKKVGDMTWHYHAGINTWPIQVAVRYKIPLIVWGEFGFSELTGMFNPEDMNEFSKKVRQEHQMRGFEPEDIIRDPESDITLRDVAPYIYPEEEAIEELGLVGVYMGNYIPWDHRKQVEMLIKDYDFKTAVKRDRTFNIYNKLEDLTNGTHDYLKYLKFGYGRATDDASMEIRQGRMTREEGIEFVRQYDHVRPKDLDLFLDFVGMTEEEFEACVEHLRDPRIWEKSSDGKWMVRDSVANHMSDAGVETARLKITNDRTYFIKNPLKQDSRGLASIEEDEFIYI